MGRSSFYSSLTYSPTYRLPVFVFGSIAAILVLFLFFGGFYSGSSTPFGASDTASVSAAGQHSLNSVLNETLGFERVLAINLRERRDHRDELALAAAVSGIHIDFVDGVHGNEVAAKTLPPLHTDGLPSGVIGSWRAHMNAISRVVENNWTSALILEDDVDWDIRLKPIMQNLARASTAILHRQSPGVINLEALPVSHVPATSPYGDGWDVLWFGHCYAEIDKQKGLLVLQGNDETTPATRYISSYDPNMDSPMMDFPEHTRAVFRHQGNVCSLAYAVSQAGARALLYEVGVQRFTEPFDLMLQHFCDGTFGIERPHSCISVLPQVFDHYRDVGSNSKDSDINKGEESYREKAYTPNIRWSVRLNMDKLLYGDSDYRDQYPD